MIEHESEDAINTLHERFAYVEIRLKTSRVDVFAVEELPNGHAYWACTSCTRGSYAERLSACAERLITSFSKYCKPYKGAPPYPFNEATV